VAEAQVARKATCKEGSPVRVRQRALQKLRLFGTKMPWRLALAVLAAGAAVAALVAELRAGAIWRSPLSDLVWALDAAMLVETVVALVLAVALGTRGCEIGVWDEIAAPGAAVLRRRHYASVVSTISTSGSSVAARGDGDKPVGRSRQRGKTMSNQESEAQPSPMPDPRSSAWTDILE
jgi:hypothetical protein